MGKTELFSRKQVGGVYTVNNESQTTGNIFWVDSGQTSTGSDAAGFGNNPDAPFLTVDFAISQCTANNGDIIYCMPGHAETIATAAGFVYDVAGVKVVGLGWGGDIPTFSLSAAASLVLVSAASGWLENVKLIATFATGVATGVSIEAAGDNFRMHKVLMRETAANQEFKTNWIAVATTVTDFVMTDCDLHGLIAGSDINCILFAGTSTDCLFENNRIFGDFSGDVIDHTADDALNIRFIKNRIVNMDTGAAGDAISASASSTGYAFDNYGFANKNDATIFTGDGIVWDQNSAGNTIASSGIRPHPAAVAAIP